MKSYLDARPAFLQKMNSIYGHFLICYISVLLLRLLQFHIFKNKHSTEKILDFVEKFRVFELSAGKYINITASTDFIKDLSLELKLPLAGFFS